MERDSSLRASGRSPVLEASAKQIRFASFALALGLVLAPASVSLAATCAVPEIYPSIGTALADSDCDVIVVGTGTYDAQLLVDRSLTLRGFSSDQTTVVGGVHVTGATTVAALEDLTVQGANAACLPVVSDGGAQLSGIDLVAESGNCPLFADGFESGDPTAWSYFTP